MIKCVIITHGDLGQSLISTTASIIGPLEDIKTLSNENISIKTLAENLETIIKEWEDSDIIIMVDFCGGSCWYAAQSIKRTHPAIALISGINLPMLIAYWYNRNTYAVKDLAQFLKENIIKSTEIVID